VERFLFAYDVLLENNEKRGTDFVHSLYLLPDLLP